MAFSALADPTRFRIIEMLAKNGRMPVNKINKHFKVSAPAISQHLKVLKKANLVKVEINGQQRIYLLNPAGITEVEDWLAKTRRMWESRFDAFDAMLKAEHAKTMKTKRK